MDGRGGRREGIERRGKGKRMEEGEGGGKKERNEGKGPSLQDEGVGKIHDIIAQLVEDRHNKLKTIRLDEDPQQGRGP